MIRATLARRNMGGKKFHHCAILAYQVDPIISYSFLFIRVIPQKLRPFWSPEGKGGAEGNSIKFRTGKCSSFCVQMTKILFFLPQK